MSNFAFPLLFGNYFLGEDNCKTIIIIHLPIITLSYFYYKCVVFIYTLPLSYYADLKGYHLNLATCTVTDICNAFSRIIDFAQYISYTLLCSLSLLSIAYLAYRRNFKTAVRRLARIKEN